MISILAAFALGGVAVFVALVVAGIIHGRRVRRESAVHMSRAFREMPEHHPWDVQ